MGKQVLGNGLAPATPAVGTTALYVDIADKHTKQIDDTGTIIDLTTGGGAQTSIQFKDAGVNLGTSGTVDTVDFVGAGVTATRIGNVVTATIPSGAGIDNQYVQAMQTGSQLIAGAGPTKLAFDTSIGVAANFDNVNDRLVVPALAGGTYKIDYNAFIKLNGSDATLITVDLYKNGGLQQTQSFLNLTGAASFLDYSVSKTFGVNLVAGDYVELFITIAATIFNVNVQGGGGLVSLSFERVR